MVSANAPGRMAKQARDKLALVTKTEKRALLREDNRDIANLPNHIMSSEENAKLDYKQLMQCMFTFTFVDFVDRMIIIDD